MGSGYGALRIDSTRELTIGGIIAGDEHSAIADHGTADPRGTPQRSGSYPRFGASQCSASATDQPLRAA